MAATTKTVWVDDPNTRPPGGLDFDKVGPRNRVYRMTLSYALEDEAGQLEASRPDGTPPGPYNVAVAGALRELAGRVRASGCRTPEEWLARG